MAVNRTPTPTNFNEDIFNQTYRFKPSELSKVKILLLFI